MPFGVETLPTSFYSILHLITFLRIQKKSRAPCNSPLNISSSHSHTLPTSPYTSKFFLLHPPSYNFAPNPKKIESSLQLCTQNLSKSLPYLTHFISLARSSLDLPLHQRRVNLGRQSEGHTSPCRRRPPNSVERQLARPKASRFSPMLPTSSISFRHHKSSPPFVPIPVVIPSPIA